MSKYSIQIVEKITGLIKSDSYTVSEICKQAGISETTYFDWKAKKPEFSESIKKAENDRLKMFAAEAQKSLLKKIQGYEVEETKTVYSKYDSEEEEAKAKVKEHTVIKKYIQPDTAAIIFTLTNQDPENWKNRQTNEHTGKNGEDLFKSFDYSKISTHNLKEIEKLLRSGENTE